MRREQGKAFIPAPNEHLQGLRRANQDFVACIQKRHPEREATLDTDATLVETQKKDAFFSYKGYKAYQPFNVWWAEQKVVLHIEFRDGNVPLGYEQLRVFKAALYIRKGSRKCIFVLILQAMSMIFLKSKNYFGGTVETHRIAPKIKGLSHREGR